MNNKKGLGKFLVGLGLGAGLGVLFDKKSGEETRKALKSKMDEFINAVKDIDGLLEKEVEVLKLNMEEYCELLQRLSIPLVTSSPQFWKISAMAVLERLPIKHIVVTDEENPVRVFFVLEGKLQILQLQPPTVEVVNCIGAGDSFLAGWIYADSLGLSPF